VIAALPMYARPMNRAAHDRLWVLIRDGLRTRGIDAPDALDHEVDHMHAWAREDLVLSQICNLPYRARFRGKVTLIGASDYGLPGCAPGYYNSVFLVHRDNPASNPAALSEARYVCNDFLSQSGYGAAQTWAQARGFQFRHVAQSGSHYASISAIAEDKAEIAAIDAQTWHMAKNDHAAAATLKVIGVTDPSPGMTFVTRLGQDPAPYFAAVKTAISALAPDDRAILGLRAIITLPQSAYDLPLPPKPAAFEP